MSQIQFIPVHDNSTISRVETLAKKIWPEHYVPLIGQPQVDIMLQKFQSKEAVQEQIRQGFVYYLIQDSDQFDIGYLALVPNPGETYLSKFYLAKEIRGKKYGCQAMEFVKEWARQKGAHKITLTVHKRNPSVQIYQKMGFRIIEPIVTDIGSGFFMDDYRMQLEI